MVARRASGCVVFVFLRDARSKDLYVKSSDFKNCNKFILYCMDKTNLCTVPIFLKNHQFETSVLEQNVLLSCLVSWSVTNS